MNKGRHVVHMDIVTWLQSILMFHFIQCKSNDKKKVYRL